MVDTKAINNKFANNFLQKFISNSKHDAILDSKIEDTNLTVENTGKIIITYLDITSNNLVSILNLNDNLRSNTHYKNLIPKSNV